MKKASNNSPSQFFVSWVKLRSGVKGNFFVFQPTLMFVPPVKFLWDVCPPLISVKFQWDICPHTYLCQISIGCLSPPSSYQILLGYSLA